MASIHQYIGITKASHMTGVLASNTPEERLAAKRAIAGAQACKDAQEARLFMDMLGLLD